MALQIQSWYDMESFGAYKQVHPRSASDARGQKILEETTHHDGCRYWIGMLCADKKKQFTEKLLFRPVIVPRTPSRSER